MSYDVDVRIDTGGPEPATVCEIGNCTSNLSPMWFEALGVSLKKLGMNYERKGIVDTCQEAIPYLEKGIKKMESDPDLFIAMNPKNGWGDYDGALSFLKDILRACQNNPKAYLWFST